MLTFSDIVDEARIALRGELHARVSEKRFVNGVGRRWTSAHPWVYLKGRTASIPVILGQQVYPLPADLRRIKEVLDEHRWFPAVRMVDWGEWQTRDYQDYGALNGVYLGAVNIQSTGGAPAPQLHLTPAPPEETTLRVVYDAGWKPLADDGDVADVPSWAEESFLDLARAVALAFERPSSDGNPDPMGVYVAQWKASTGFRDAISIDGALLGKIDRGTGALEDALARSKIRDRIGPRSTRQDILADL